MADDFKKTTINTKFGVDIDDQLTWGELFWFVDQAKAAGVNPDNPVGLSFNDHKGAYDSMYVYVEQGLDD